MQFLVGGVEPADQLCTLAVQQRHLALALIQDLPCLGPGVFNRPVGFLDRGRAELLVHASGLFSLAGQQRDGLAASGIQREPKVAFNLRATRLRVRPRLCALRLRLRPRPFRFRCCFGRGGGLLDLLGVHPPRWASPKPDTRACRYRPRTTRRSGGVAPILPASSEQKASSAAVTSSMIGTMSG